MYLDLIFFLAEGAVYNTVASLHAWVDDERRDRRLIRIRYTNNRISCRQVSNKAVALLFVKIKNPVV